MENMGLFVPNIAACRRRGSSRTRLRLVNGYFIGHFSGCGFRFGAFGPIAVKRVIGRQINHYLAVSVRAFVISAR